MAIVSFLIYKEWLILLFDDKSASRNIVLQHFKEELLTRLKTCELCTKFSIKEKVNLEALINNI